MNLEVYAWAKSKTSLTRSLNNAITHKFIMGPQWHNPLPCRHRRLAVAAHRTYSLWAHNGIIHYHVDTGTSCSSTQNIQHILMVLMALFVVNKVLPRHSLMYKTWQCHKVELDYHSCSGWVQEQHES